ncbi:unnamed protein product, partial [Ectocarpus fasciculatus]
LLVTALLVAIGVAYLLVSRFGFGEIFTLAPVEFMEADTHHSVLQSIAELPVPPGNIAVSATGRVFFTFHPEFKPRNTKVAELTYIRERRNTFRKFPSTDFQDRCVSCLALRVDMTERLWVLDHGGHGIEGTPALHAVQLRRNETDKDNLIFSYDFPSDVAGMGSFLNDFQVDADGDFIYIADTSMLRGDPGLIVFSVQQRTSVRVLSSHSSMFGVSSFFDVGETTVKLPGPLGMRINVDSIALDRVAGRWLYFGAMTSHNLFAVPDDDNTKAASAKLSAAVMLVTDEKPVTDGLSTDPMGNIYMTAPENELMFTTPPKFKLRKFVQSDDHLRWPDGISFGPKGLYVTASALHVKLMGLDINGHAPFHIFKV